MNVEVRGEKIVAEPRLGLSKVSAPGALHPDLGVPFREMALRPTAEEPPVTNLRSLRSLYRPRGGDEVSPHGRGAQQCWPDASGARARE